MEVIKQNRDFLRIFHKGKSAYASTLIVYVCKSRREGKFAVVAGKKVGGAVVRNRAKRLLRAAFYEITKEYELPGKTDFIFVARNGIQQAKMDSVKADMLRCLKRLEII